MRRILGCSSKQGGPTVSAVRPIGLDGAVTSRAGRQDFRAAARAEDEVLLHRRTALRTGSGGRQGWAIYWPGSRI